MVELARLPSGKFENLRNILNTNEKWYIGELRAKIEATPYSLLFLSSPIASKHSAAPLTEVLASEISTIWKKFVLKDRLQWPPF